ncbi:MAG: hypothetical protein M3Z23_02000 [Acidobacteriota bacterium]|nr:hypothetical protein [Acidobacteriota bacterium]
MKLRNFAVTGCLLGGLTALTWAQEGDPQQALMKNAGAEMKALKKNLDGGMKDDAAKDARHLAGIFKQVEEIWAKTNTAGAVKLAKDAQAASNDIASGTGDATVSFKALGASCAACHAAHREKSEDGSYRTKP